MLRLIDTEQYPEPDGGIVVSSGSMRADILFVSRDAFAQQFPGVSLDGLTDRGGAGLIIAVDDLAAAAEAVGSAGVKVGDRVVVPPSSADGVLVVFTTDSRI
jgi:hypothetical protein